MKRKGLYGSSEAKPTNQAICTILLEGFGFLLNVTLKVAW